MIPDAIGYIIKYSKYKTDNYLIFGDIDLVLVESIFSGRLDHLSLAKDGRSVFLDIDAYHQG